MPIHHTRVFAMILCSLMLSQTHSAMALTAKVAQTPAGPVLQINGKPTAPIMLYTGLIFGSTEIGQAEISAAKQQGVHIVSVITTFPWTRPGQTPDYTAVDQWIDKVLAANPNALIIPRFQTDGPPDWWKSEHPGDVMKFDDGTVGPLACVHSPAWRKDAAMNIRAYVKHMETKYGNNIAGYHVTGQTSDEWFYWNFPQKVTGFEPAAVTAFQGYLRTKYRTDGALRKAWADPSVTINTAGVPTVSERTEVTVGQYRDPQKQQKAIDFDEFANIGMADAVALMCKAAKDAAPNKLAIAFYGYQMEQFGLPGSGGLALGRLLKSPYIDAIVSPTSYYDRSSGGSGAMMGAFDSVRLHGKLWLTEDDTRTFLADPDAGFGRCADLRETLGVLQRNFAVSLTHGAGQWWGDIASRGWFNDKAIWQNNGKLVKAYNSNIAELTKYSPEIAVILDERSCYYHPASQDYLLHVFRQQYYRIGAPVGVYLLDDLVAGKLPKAKMYIFLDTFRLDKNQLRAIKKQACRSGNVLLWMSDPGIVRGDVLSPSHVSEVVKLGEGTGCSSYYANATTLPAATLTKYAAQAGVHLYSVQNDVVAAGNSYVSIHASTAGPKTLHMPYECGLTSVTDGLEMDKASTFKFDMLLGETRLFHINR
ncbi:MAG: beta-galactosidase [Armatimonadota bacterium]